MVRKEVLYDRKHDKYKVQKGENPEEPKRNIRGESPLKRYWNNPWDDIIHSSYWGTSVWNVQIEYGLKTKRRKTVQKVNQHRITNLRGN